MGMANFECGKSDCFRLRCENVHGRAASYQFKQGWQWTKFDTHLYLYHQGSTVAICFSITGALEKTVLGTDKIPQFESGTAWHDQGRKQRIDTIRFRLHLDLVLHPGSTVAIVVSAHRLSHCFLFHLLFFLEKKGPEISTTPPPITQQRKGPLANICLCHFACASKAKLSTRTCLWAGAPPGSSLYPTQGQSPAGQGSLGREPLGRELWRPCLPLR